MSMKRDPERKRLADFTENFAWPATGPTFHVSYDWPDGGHLFVTSSFGEGSELGYEVSGIDGNVITFARAPFLKRLFAYPRLLAGHYRNLRQQHGRLVSFHLADTLALKVLR